MNREPTIELVRAALEGNSVAWEKIDRRYREVLALLKRGKVSRVSRGKILTEEVVQSAMIRAFTELESYDDRGPGSFGKWLRTIMENRLRSKLRRLYAGKRDMDREDGQSSVIEGEFLHSSAATPAELAEKAELMARMMDAIARLPEDQRRIITLTEIDRITLRDAARELGLSESAARRRVASALVSLAQMLSEYDGKWDQ